MPRSSHPPGFRWKFPALIAALPALLIALLVAPAPTSAAAAGLTIIGLTADGRAGAAATQAQSSPATKEQSNASRSGSLAVTSARPDLGWQLASPGHDVRQSAYRVVVATSARRLAQGEADVWDSGKVASATSVDVPYGGPALTAGHRYYWRVRVWDNQGADSGWSKPATLDTALDAKADWHGAQWITPDRSGSGTWKDFTLDTDFTIKSAAASVLFRAADASHYYMWQVNAASTPGKILLRPHVNNGGSFRLLGETDLGSVITAATLHEQHHLRVTVSADSFTTWIDGTLVDSRTDSTLTAGGTIGFRTSATAGTAEDSLYDNLTVRGTDGSTLFSDDFSTSPDPNFPGVPLTGGQSEPKGDPTLLDRDAGAPMLRKKFTVDKPIAQAHAYVFGLGLYELRLNGAKVGNQVLTPANSPYDKRDLYDTYDVTSALKRGANAVGIWLGRGYGPNFSPYGFRWTGPEQAIMLIAVTYTDGTQGYVTTDPSWKWSNGPILADDIYNGEVYDARAAHTGWDTAGYDDADWQPATTASAPGGELQAASTPALRVTQTLSAAKITQPSPGTYIYDFGQNIAGWERVQATGAASTAIRMRTAEELKADGTLDTTTNRGASATDEFVLAGTGSAETYEPRFTYHGFRYLEVTGYPGTPTTASIKARVVHADVSSTGTFTSSDTTLNRIWQNNRWSILNNSMSVPTDNPVRDERTSPAMDVQAYHDAAVREFGMDAFYANYLQNMPPGTALPNDAGNAQQPDMAGGQITLAWSLYEQYGDKQTLATAYPDMKKFVDTNNANVPGHIWPDDKGFGDWCPPYYGPGTNDGMGSPSAGACFSEVSLVNTALSYVQAQDTAKAAQALGHADDVQHYSDIADAIKQAFNDHFLNADGDTYGDGRQVTSILPLAFGMVPADKVAAVGAQLVSTIQKHDNSHLDTGIFGTRYLMDALTAIDRTDLAMTLLDQTSYPGFGFEIAHGATSSWEEWLYSSGMETHDHAMFAGINASFYAVLGGITPTSPGYQTFEVNPQFPSSLNRVSTTQDTVRGRIGCSWTRQGNSIYVTVTVPANSSAKVRMPLPTQGAEVHATAGARRSGDTGSGARTASYSVGSGTWKFRIG